MWNECNCVVVSTFFGIALLWFGIKSNIFSWPMATYWHTECSTFTPSSFRIWNSSAGILSPALAFLVVILPKAHLTSHSRMSGSRWVITPSGLSGSWRSFLYSFSVYSCLLFLIFSVSERSVLFLNDQFNDKCNKCRYILNYLFIVMLLHRNN